MFEICFGSMGLGILIGLIFSLLYINFDTNWKKVLTSLITVGAGGTGIWGIYKVANVSDTKLIFTSIGCLSLSFLLTFIIFMIIMCKIIKDKDDNDILRIRDILLGQKQYIEKYYEKRSKEIDDKLNIPALTKREEELNLKENHIISEREILEHEKIELNKMQEGKLRIKLPEKKNLAVTTEFLELFPAYVENLASFIEGLKSETNLFIENHTTIQLEDLRVFLFILSIQTLEHLFGKGAKDVRVHFRCYNEKREGYEKIVSVIGDKKSNRDLTFIPYNKANMIIKSYECKRALIKSHNLDYDFEGINSTTWTEYITYTFYNITRNDRPCFSFGISVKSGAKYKHLLNFLNYCKFESYLQEVIEQFNESYNIESLLYDKT